MMADIRYQTLRSTSPWDQGVPDETLPLPISCITRTSTIIISLQEPLVGDRPIISEQQRPICWERVIPNILMVNS